MKVTTITFMQTFPTGNFANVKMGVEIEVESPHPSTGESDHDYAMDAFKEAKELVNAAFHKMNPGIESIPENGYLLATHNGGIYTQLPETQIKKEPKEAAIDSQIEAINGCTSMKSLEIFKKLVDRENNNRLTDAYNNKLEFLSGQ